MQSPKFAVCEKKIEKCPNTTPNIIDSALLGLAVVERAFYYGNEGIISGSDSIKLLNPIYGPPEGCFGSVYSASKF
jgi:hypothetical protein